MGFKYTFEANYNIITNGTYNIVHNKMYFFNEHIFYTFYLFLKVNLRIFFFVQLLRLGKSQALIDFENYSTGCRAESDQKVVYRDDLASLVS